METKPLHLAKIKVESWLQPRDSLDAEAIADYTRVYKSCRDKESPFPSWRVFLIDGKYYLTRGFHREVAAKAADRSTHICEVIKGTRQEALIDAAGSNADNGVRRTNKDKRRAVLMLLTSKDAPEWSNRFIATSTHTTHQFVNLMAKELAAENGKPAKRSTRKKKKKAASSGHPDENQPDLTPIERMAEMNNDIERLCRGVLKMYDDGIAPLHCKNLWLIYEDRVKAARSKIDSACNTIRQAKGKAICAACEGEGCDKCKSTGYIPRQMVEHLQ